MYRFCQTYGVHVYKKTLEDYWRALDSGLFYKYSVFLKIEKYTWGRVRGQLKQPKAESPNIYDGYFFEANQTWINNRSCSQKSTNVIPVFAEKYG